MTEGFPIILEKALSRPDSFFISILPQLQDLSEDKLEALASVLDSGSVIDKQNVTRLFIEHLKEEGAAYLVEHLDVKRPKLFISAANIIGELKYEASLTALASALKKDYPDLVLPAIKAISSLPVSDKVLDILSDFFINFEDDVILTRSIKYLSICSKELVSLLMGKYPALVTERQMWLLKYFATVGDNRALPLFIEEYTKYPEEKGIYCIEGLGRIGSDEAVEALKNGLRSEEWFLRKQVVTALGISNNVNAIEPLLAALADSHVLVRGSAVKSLSLVGNKNPDLLIAALKSADKRVKANLVRVMGLLKNESFVESLIDILKERDSLFFSIDAVGDLGFSKAEYALRRLLKDGVWFNRLNALEALAKLQSRDLMTFAQEALEDENDMVRNSASRILSALKAKQALS